jgi:hypothetical protein
MDTRSHRRSFLLGVCMAAGLLTTAAGAQTPAGETGLSLPAGTTRLEGLPRVRVDTSETTTRRHVLAPAEAAGDRLTIRVDGNRYFLGDSTRPLTVERAGAFVYLSSTEPGKYIRVRRVNDRLTYVEHVDQGARSVTYWGELRVVLGR